MIKQLFCVFIFAIAVVDVSVLGESTVSAVENKNKDDRDKRNILVLAAPLLNVETIGSALAGAAAAAVSLIKPKSLSKNNKIVAGAASAATSSLVLLKSANQTVLTSRLPLNETSSFKLSPTLNAFFQLYTPLDGLKSAKDLLKFINVEETKKSHSDKLIQTADRAGDRPGSSGVSSAVQAQSSVYDASSAFGQPSFVFSQGAAGEPPTPPPQRNQRPVPAAAIFFPPDQDDDDSDGILIMDGRTVVTKMRLSWMCTQTWPSTGTHNT